MEIIVLVIITLSAMFGFCVVSYQETKKAAVEVAAKVAAALDKLIAEVDHYAK